MQPSEFDGAFRGIVMPYEGVGELKMIEPWAPYWVPAAAGEEDGYHYRPEYYMEPSDLAGFPRSQAVRTSWATYEGGIYQGPFEVVGPSMVVASAFVKLMTRGKVSGEGCARMFLSLGERKPDVVDGSNIWSPEQVYRYDVWSPLRVEATFVNHPFYVCLYANWKWRAELNVAFWTNASLQVIEPEPEPGPGAEVTLETKWYRFHVRVEEK